MIFFIRLVGEVLYRVESVGNKKQFSMVNEDIRLL